MSVCGGRCLWGSIDGGDRWCSRWFHAARLNGGRRSRRRGRHLRGASRRRRCPTPGPGPSARRMNGHHRDSGRNAGNWDLEPPARRRCSNHWTSKDDIVRLRVTKRGQQQPDHIATYRGVLGGLRALPGSGTSWLLTVDPTPLGTRPAGTRSVSTENSGRRRSFPPEPVVSGLGLPLVVCHIVSVPSNLSGFRKEKGYGRECAVSRRRGRQH